MQFTLRHWLWGAGRSGRLSYYSGLVGLTLLGWVSHASGPPMVMAGAPITIVGPIMLVIEAASFWLMTCLQSRRLHDFGRSGWWQALAVAIAFAGALLLEPLFSDNLGALKPAGRMVGGVGILAYLAFLIGIGAVRGSPDPNRFGPPPGRFD